LNATAAPAGSRGGSCDATIRADQSAADTVSVGTACSTLASDPATTWSRAASVTSNARRARSARRTFPRVGQCPPVVFCTRSASATAHSPATSSHAAAQARIRSAAVGGQRPRGLVEGVGLGTIQNHIRRPPTRGFNIPCRTLRAWDGSTLRGMCRCGTGGGRPGSTAWWPSRCWAVHSSQMSMCTTGTA
jgi:hypothetical protein